MTASTQRVGAVVLAALIAGCGDPGTIPSGPIDLAAEWETASPEALGFDDDRLDAAVRHAETLPNMLSLLVVRHGRIAVEEYFSGNDASRQNDVRSVTKSVVSTLVGIAVARGELPGIDVPIGSYLAADYGSELTPAESAITIRDLLTMTSGYQWDESGTAAYNAWVLSPDPARYLLERPLTSAPGTSFTYNSAAVHVLARVLEEATGVTVREFARQHLFPPLGIPGATWEILADGSTNGGSGIDLRPRDLAKLGALWLQRGDPGSGAILPADWVTAGTTSRLPLWQGGAPLARQGYGFLWWIDQTPSRTHFFAWGHGGQFVWVAPELDMVVVVTTDWRAATVPASQLATNGFRLIVEHILPAAR